VEGLGGDVWLMDRATTDAANGTWLIEDGHATSINNTMALVHVVQARELRRVLKRRRVNCVIDAGANIGQFAKRVRALGWRGRIVSFEPVPHLFEKLQQEATGDRRWRVVNVALGREDTQSEINVTPGAGVLSSLLPPSDFGLQHQERLSMTVPVTVTVRRLEGLLPEVLDGIKHPRVYLKMDTQGYDLEVFNGLGSGIDHVVAMQSEVAALALYEGMPDMIEALNVYRANGFDLSGLWPVTYERGTHRALEFDAMLVRRPPSDPSA
jgi:FkbM family methyltransferase